MKLILYQSTIAVTEIDFVLGLFRCQIEQQYLDFAVGILPASEWEFLAHAGLPWSGVRTSRYPRHSGRRPPSLSASGGSAPPCLSTVFPGPEVLPAPSLGISFFSLFYVFAPSACACIFEVTVTSVSLPSFVSHRGLFNHTIVSLSP